MSLIGSIVERKPSSAPSVPPKAPASSSSGVNGFPAVQHRSKSVFARNKEEARRQGAGARGMQQGPPQVPVVVPAGAGAPNRSGAAMKIKGGQQALETGTASMTTAAHTLPALAISSMPTPQPPASITAGKRKERDPGLEEEGEQQWRKRMSEENDRRLDSMSQEEIDEEKREILERFGAGIGDLFRKVREARERRAAGPGAQGSDGKDEKVRESEKDLDGLEEVPIAPSRRQSPTRLTAGSPPPALTTSSTRPSSRATLDRKLRFAELSPDDVHVYESAPPSPKRKPLLALPSPVEGDKDVVSLGEWKGRLVVPQPKRADEGHLDSAISLEAEDRNAGGEIVSKETTNVSTQVPAPAQKLAATVASDEPEEGTPEYIRRRFFPDAPANDPNLAWMSPDPQASTGSGTGVATSAGTNSINASTTSPADTATTSSYSQRFDLHGAPIPETLSSTLPTHLGLHHHAEGTHAGYTLDDIFLLTRSTVPAQRATMLSVLAGIARRARKQAEGKFQDAHERIREYEGKEEDLRKRILGAGVNALIEKGSVGARAIEVIWECVVGWSKRHDDGLDDNYDCDSAGDNDADSDNIGGGMELQQPERDNAISSLQVEQYFLPQITVLLSQGGLTPESSLQVLDIVYRLARHSNAIITAIINTKALLTTILQTFLLTPVTPSPSSTNQALPNPLTLKLLIVLIKSSRFNASALLEYTDPLLRFITMLPPDSSPYPQGLAAKLVGLTLEVYRALAGYGFYSNIASTAMERFDKLARWIKESGSPDTHALGSHGQLEPRTPFTVPRKVVVSWLRLLESWIVCAVDPHKTTPDHDILWSQVVGWGWSGEVWSVRALLTSRPRSLSKDAGKDGVVWGAMWSALSVWLEGCRVNGIRGGEDERNIVLGWVESGFQEGGVERGILGAALQALKEDLQGLDNESLKEEQAVVVNKLHRLGRNARVVSSAVRLWLACTPSSKAASGPLASPPFDLPYPSLSQLSAIIVNHPLWTVTSGLSSLTHLLRPLSTFLWRYLHLSRCLPGIPSTLWVAQALTILTRLQPGDEDAASDITEELTSLMSVEWLVQNGLRVPDAAVIKIWEKGGFRVLDPFFADGIRPRKEELGGEEDGDGDDGGKESPFVGPLCPTPKSVASTTTLRLVAPSSTAVREYGLPLFNDWMLLPLNHLLRSGTSPVFKNLPPGWDADEVEVTTAALTFANTCREILTRFKLREFVLTREEAVFGCMKVYMLEHGQDQNDSMEVFRDKVVEGLMQELLKPYRFSESESFKRISHASTSTPSPQSLQPSRDLEQVAKRFLGTTPFYQWYTDFVQLYDSISFSQPLFSTLLLPPTSMSYPVDYRKYLWAEYGHVIRNLRKVKTEDVICGDLREYLWPVESDPEVIGAYLRRAVRGETEEFTRFVAVHHLACNIWKDLERGREGEKWWKEERASKLVKAIVDQGGMEVVKEVLRYNQPQTSSEGDVWLPPRCFENVEGVREERLRALKEWGGERYVERLKGVYDL